MMKPLELVRPEVVAAEVEYVLAARGVLARVWRATVAARRCARLAAEERARRRGTR